MRIQLSVALRALRHFYRRAHPTALAVAITLTVTPAASAASAVFSTPGRAIDAIDFDPDGNLFYLDRGATTTRLMTRTKSSGYADSSVVFDYAASGVFGSFVTVNGGRVFFGESTNGTIRSVPLTGGSVITNATVAFNYDLEFSTTSGAAFLSANPLGGQNSQIFELNLASGLATVLVSNTSDYSGPIAFDLAGDLYYGSTGFGVNPGDPTNIFSFTASQITNALNTATILDLSEGALAATTSGSSAFDYVNSEGLYRNYSGSNLSLVDLGTGVITPVPDPPVGFLGPMAHNGMDLYGITTDFPTNSSTFFLIPEPSGSLLLFCSAGLAAIRRRRL